MKTVIAALDAGATASTVLDTAIRVGELVTAAVTVVHVDEGRPRTPEWLAVRANLPLLLLEGGPVEARLLETAAQHDTVVAVLGARSAIGGRRPVGHIAMHLLERCSKPVVVVPREMRRTPSRRIRRLLVPLEGNEDSSEPVRQALESLIATSVDVAALHVFTKDAVPPMLDRPQRDLQLWSDDFLVRFCPTASTLELRTGSIGRGVEDVCDALAPDMIVLSWAQDNTPGHAAVIRDVLARATIPVMILPTIRHTPEPPASTPTTP
jgi:hypothetical protein